MDVNVKLPWKTIRMKVRIKSVSKFIPKIILNEVEKPKQSEANNP